MNEITQLARARTWRPALVAIDPLATLGCLSFALGLALRLSQRDNLPLWLDEAITGAVVAQPSLSDVIRQVLLDVNSPAYFIIAHLWTSFTSLSNEALRAPALIFGLAGPFVCLVAAPGVSRRARWVWFALVALWLPVIHYANEARAYSLVYALAVANTLAFTRFHTHRTLASAWLWSASVSALLLSHYIALFIVAAQGAIILLTLRERILRFWTAFLPVAPALAFMIVHAPRIREYAHPDVAWHPLLEISIFPRIAIWTFGGYLTALAVAGLCCLLIAGRFTPAQSTSCEPAQKGARVAALAGGMGWIAFLVVCLFRPNFTSRYLIVFAPALLLGVALLAERAASVRRSAPAALVLIAIAQGVMYTAADRKTFNTFEFQSGSRFLMNAGAYKVTFLWDSPTNRVADPGQMDLVGGFFLKRDRSPASVKSIRLSQGADPNAELAAAAAEVGEGFIWLYDLRAQSTAAIAFPPRFNDATSGFACHTSGDGSAMVLSCIRRKG
jgi:hypothetical protein